MLDVFPDEPWGCGRGDAASWSRVGSAAPADSLQEKKLFLFPRVTFAGSPVQAVIKTPQGFLIMS